MKLVGRNEPCPCGSGKKYKKCCLEKDQQAEQIPLRDMSHGDDLSLDDDLTFYDDMPMDEEEEKYNKFWDKYEIANFNEKVSMIDEVYNDPSLMDADVAYEILNELNNSATTALERKTYTNLVLRLKESYPKIYKKEAGYFLDHRVVNAIIDKQMSELKSVFLEYAGYAHKIIDVFNLRIDQLAYHGHLELLKEGFRIGWKKVESSEKIVTWGINEFALRGSDFELLSYLENNSNPSADDRSLIKRMEFYYNLDRPAFRKYFSSITRTNTPTWRHEDIDVNPKALRKKELFDCVDSVSHLCNEFLDFLHKEEKKTYSKAELMRTEIREYLIKRVYGDLEPQAKPRKRKPLNSNNIVNILCPDRPTLDQYLAQLMNPLSYRLYRAVALYESTPYWLKFLELNHLIDHSSRNDVQNAIAHLYKDVEQLIMQHDYVDEFAMNELKAAWN